MQRSSMPSQFVGVSEGRRRIMRSIRSTETKPERRARSILHRLGYRFRKNLRSLPGCPDVVFPKKKKAIFVHGCFWHGHACANGGKPRSRTEYWLPKLKATSARDFRNVKALEGAGWSVLTIWECQLKSDLVVAKRFSRFLGPPNVRHARGFRRKARRHRGGA